MISLPRLFALVLIPLTLLLILLACGSEEPTERRESTRSERSTEPAPTEPQTGRSLDATNTPDAEEGRRPGGIFSPTNAETDREALVALYNATNGGNWSQNDNWLSDEPVSEWYGVEVDEDGRVTGLYLSGNNMIGDIPPEIADVEHLALLDLQQNLLSGEIPPELGNLRNLKFLVLLVNQLDGEIPEELGKLSNLEMLALNGNQLSGEIPGDLGDLSNLRALALDNNQLSGEIPPELGGLDSLTDLNVQFNQLRGEIPAELGNLRSLRNLWVSGNRLSGEIPPELGGLANLESLLAGDNSLQGEIPPELGNLSGLVTLALYLNQFSGQIPRELGRLTNLETLALGVNRLVGYVPSELGNLDSLKILAISANPLEGCVPQNLRAQLDMQQSNLGYLPFCTVIALTTSTPPPQPTLAPHGVATPVATPSPRATGGPGAVYRGDGNWAALAGPAVMPEFQGRYDLGNGDGQVPLDAILQHQWIFESDYYRSLVAKARLNNPAPLTSSGQNITLRFACINRSLYWCEHLQAYFAPNIEERTNGQVNIEFTSFPELGLSGLDTGALLADGTLEIAEVYSGYVSREFPSFEIQNFWGLSPDDQTKFEAQAAMAPGLDRIVADEMGAQALFRNWIANGGLFFFSGEALETPEDFSGMRVRSFGHTLSDWISGMGGEPQPVAFAEVYTALERGFIDAGVTNAISAYGQRWYEVTDYMNGPLYGFDSTISAVNRQVWDSISADLQQILIEEGAKHELEALRLAAIQNLTGIQRNIETGLEFVEFSPEIQAQSRQVAIECVVPGWLERIGYASTGGCEGTASSTSRSTAPAATQVFQPTPAPTTSGQPRPSASAVRAVDIFNSAVGPIVGLRIEADGTVTELR